MGWTSRIDSIKSRYELIKQEQLEGVLESFRHRDQDAAGRGGGLLGFSGLMMASDLVFLSADALRPKPLWADVALVALIVLAAGAWLAYLSLSVSGDYTRDTTARAFLERWEQQLRRRSLIQRFGAALTVLGTSIFLLAMLANRIWP